MTAAPLVLPSHLMTRDSGSIPAWRAARLNPIAALGCE